MKFRFVWMGADEDPLWHSPAVNPDKALLAPSGTSSYEQRGHEMFRCERLANGRLKHIAIANFSARIVFDLIRDDDGDQRRELGIEAEVSGQKLAFLLPTSEFGGMGWVLRKLGPQAIIYPGQQQHVRAAIQWLSASIRQECIYSHLGWRKHGPDWIYLHAGGAIGVHGADADMRIELPPALKHFE